MNKDFVETTHGFWIRKGMALEDKTLFGKWIDGKITFSQMKRSFMRDHEIEHLDDDVFRDWLSSLGWRKRYERPEEVEDIQA